MPIGVKVVLSLVLLAVISGFALVNPDSTLVRSDSRSRRKVREPFRSLLLRPDGALRPHAQPLALLVLYALLAILWFGVPIGCSSTGNPVSEFQKFTFSSARLGQVFPIFRNTASGDMPSAYSATLPAGVPYHGSANDCGQNATKLCMRATD